MTYDRSGSVPYKPNGNVPVSVEEGSVTLTTTDIEVGGVEIKNGTDDTRATVTPANALKVDGSGVTQPVSISGTLPVSGSVSVTSAPTTAVTGPLTDTQLRALAVPVSGSVSVSNLPATQAVSGSVSVSNLPATQAVSGTVTATGPLTDTQLRATAVPVSGAVTATGTVAVSNTGFTVTNTPSVSPVDSSGVTATRDGTVLVQDMPLRRELQELQLLLLEQTALLRELVERTS